jgi:hypothetical protein
MTLHVALACWVDQTIVVITSTFSGFLVWVILFIVAFLANNGWKSWCIYLLITLLLVVLSLVGHPELLSDNHG